MKALQSFATRLEIKDRLELNSKVLEFSCVCIEGLGYDKKTFSKAGVGGASEASGVCRVGKAESFKPYKDLRRAWVVFATSYNRFWRVCAPRWGSFGAYRR